jgi:hypothetical protein
MVFLPKQHRFRPANQINHIAARVRSAGASAEVVFCNQTVDIPRSDNCPHCQIAWDRPFRTDRYTFVLGPKSNVPTAEHLVRLVNAVDA